MHNEVCVRLSTTIILNFEDLPRLAEYIIGDSIVISSSGDQVSMPIFIQLFCTIIDNDQIMDRMSTKKKVQNENFSHNPITSIEFTHNFFDC
jgi:hypothetical protein